MKRVFRHILFCFTLLTGVSAGAQVNAEQVLAIGRNVLAMDDYVLAIQYFNHAAQAKPYMWEPYYYRALAKLMLDDFHGAEQDASQAVAINKFKYEGFRVRGFARMRLGRDSAAVADFDAGLAYAPADRYFLYYKGIAQTQMGNFVGADSTLSELLQLYPRFEDGYNARAQSHLLAADTTAALRDIEAALRINTNMLQPRLMRADVALHRRRWAEAAAELDTVVSLTPADASLYVNRAYARYNADDWSGAMADYNYALDLEADNYPALYNRALLRFQVQDLQGARADFTAVLSRDPDDFPARYNRGLINLELRDYRRALTDFKLIASKYPRFYPIYYAISRAEQGLGNNKAAADNFFKANDLITRYTANPKNYQLDRPTIQSGSTREHTASAPTGSEAAPEEVMEHFNELVTVSQSHQDTPLYGEKLRGRVQDIDMKVQPEPPYSLTFVDPTDELRFRSGTYSELSDINASHWLSSPLYMGIGSSTPQDTELIQEMFDKVAELDNLEARQELRPIDRLARAVALTAIKNYEEALADLDAAIAANPAFVSALLQRAYVRQQLTPEGTSSDALIAEAAQRDALQAALTDYDAALRLDPRLAQACMGKGCVLYACGDWRGAAECFTQALALQPDMGAAIFNRALCLLHLGARREAMADLSRAGELGIVKAYNILKNI